MKKEAYTTTNEMSILYHQTILEFKGVLIEIVRFS